MENEPVIIQSALLERGWTKLLIEKFLPQPTLKKNPRYACASPMRLWKLTDVEAAEKTEAFCVALEKTKVRSRAAKKVAKAKADQLNNEIEVIIAQTHIKKIKTDKLEKLAITAKQKWYDEAPFSRFDGEIRDARGANRQTIERWVVNYIRHNLIAYDSVLDSMKGRVGVVAAYPNFKSAILDKIAEVYPEYKKECCRQKEIDPFDL